MIPLILSSLLIAGGNSFLGSLVLPTNATTYNHTLAGEKIEARKVVCRDRWGTPMLPDGKASYSLIAPISESLIAQSLWIPPASGTRPKPALSAPTNQVVTTAPVVSPVVVPVVK
jgi:hypothetical protein